ncbi:MAG TPA: YetF domain-containing protein [Tepidisphaeraceae bacterium]|nr:YetF domain-containing protein [Tepidisphaeraceae bacterium]
MNTFLRVAVIYLILMILFRIMGKRSLASITTFDFVVLLIISETTQQAMIGNDFSVTNALIAILTLLVLDLGLSFLKAKSPLIDRWMDSVPVIIVEDGKTLDDRMGRARVDRDDILMAARMSHGLERIDQIKFAVLERSGEISIIPEDEEK